MKQTAALLIFIGVVAIFLGLTKDRSKGLANLPLIVILIFGGAVFFGIGVAMLLAAIWQSI
jgi:hypothetical protein